MASSNIKLFDENKGNMISDSEFSISNQRLNGLQTGVASSQLQNKAMYQASLVAYAIAQVMMQNGLNANDTDAVSTFVANLSNTMLQKVYDVATTAEAQAGVAAGKWMSPALVKAAIDTLAAKAQNILSDETKALYSLGSGAVPNDAFAKIVQLLQNKADLGEDGKVPTDQLPDMDYAPSNHTQSASTITAGTFAGKVRADPTARAVLTDYQLRDIAAGSTDMTAGSTGLSNGLVYLVYE